MDACDTIATQKSASEIPLQSSSSHESGGEIAKNATSAEIVATDTAPSHQTETVTKAEEYASQMKGQVDQAKDISSTTSNEVGCYNSYTYMCGNTTIIDVE